jgi:hypothetical protein
VEGEVAVAQGESPRVGPPSVHWSGP